jgi:predicted dehydrogenase/threonine dehydrogenase-like Zn-dependent dehydrogenase
MKQLVREPGSGVLRVEAVPAPVVRAGGVLVRTAYSVISIGTERTKLEFGRKSLLGKARARPDQVRQVLDVVRREGVASAYRKARHRLTAFTPLGYSSAGVVVGVGEGVREFRVGDRVACAGAGYANHAELNWVPQNLVVPVPEGVALEGAAFATLGAIALQGVRQAGVELGENVVVIGLGLLGQLTVQLLRAAGVRPIGVDVDAARVELAAGLGALGVERRDDVVDRVRVATGGIGADAVIITAATSSEDPMRLACELARQRGRVVVVGEVPIRVPRSPAYEKELEVRLSRSYGPGRYDPSYEEGGHDYPVGYVRWTEGRNLGEFVRLLAAGSLDLAPLITHRYDFADAVAAYNTLSGAEGKGALGVVLRYPEEATPEPRRIELAGGGAGAAEDGSAPDGAQRAGGAGTSRGERPARRSRVGIGLVGAGGFASGVLLPELRRLDVELRGVATASGLTARDAAEKHGFRYMAGSADEILADPEVEAVIIATRHDEHARLAAEALRAGKAVFVEKPLALDDESLDEVLGAAATGGLLMVGFNRRFAPATVFLRERLARLAGARVVQIRVNAGAIPPDSWVHDPVVGGGRLLGEGCHFVDLALYLAGSPAVEVSASALGGADPAAPLRDNVQVTLHCADGSLASVLYTSKGDPRSGKERVEVYAGGATGVIDDFRRAEFWSGRRERWKGTQDKGHAAELRAFIEAVRSGGAAPIPLAELENSSRATLRAAAALRLGGVPAGGG